MFKEINIKNLFIKFYKLKFIKQIFFIINNLIDFIFKLLKKYIFF